MKKLFFALPFLLAGCQAERVAFQFRPVAPAAGAARRAERPVLAAEAPTSPAQAPEPAPGSGANPDLPGQPAPRGVAAAKRLARSPQPAILPQVATAEALAAPAAEAAAGPRALASRLVLRRLVRQRATAGPARTAESGLGNIGLFFIAVLLGVLAGLGALVSVIFGTGFFTGVGFAAAGLVVLFLLYSLLSGGKKKTKPTK